MFIRVYIVVFVTYLTMYECSMIKDNETIIVGLFSMCEDHVNKTDLNRKALLSDHIVKQIIHKPCEDLCTKENWTPFTYQRFDVCDDQSLLTKLTINILLDGDYQYSKSNETLINTPEKRNSKVVVVITYMGQDLHDLLFSLFHADSGKPIVYCLNSEILVPNESESESYITTPYIIESDVFMFKYLLKYFKWQKIGLLFLNSSSAETRIYKPIFDALLEIFQNKPDLCYFYDFVIADDNKEVNRVAKILDSEFQSNVIFLFGTPQDQLKLIERASTMYHTRHSWFSQDIYKNLEYFIKFRNFKMISFKNPQRVQLTRNKRHFIKSKRKFKEYYVDGGKTAEGLYNKVEILKKYTQYSTKQPYLKPYASSLQNLFNEVLIHITVIRDDSIYDNNIKSSGFIEYFQNYGYQNRTDDVLVEFTKDVFVGSHCKESYCKKGLEKVKIKLPASQRKWLVDYRWTCRKCINGYYKGNHGNNESCKSCPNWFISNDNRTACFYPYTETPAFEKSVFFAINTLLSLLGTLLISVILLTFLYFRKTPVGKSSDVPLTILHLFSFGISIVIMFLFHYWAPTNDSCLVYASMVGALYALSVSIVFMKTHKLLKAFNLKRKATAKDRIMTTFEQLFSIFILTLISIILSAISITQETPRIFKTRDTKAFRTSSHCINTLHINAQIGYAIILQVGCILTAYRGKNLPSIFMESITLVFASLLTTLSFAVMFPIQYFQTDRYVYEHIPWTVFLINGIMLIVFSYGKKIYIMIFVKRKNTSEYVKMQTFKAMQQRATTSLK